MFCPQCGSTQNDELKFCKSCGANLQALRQVMATRDDEGKFDWSKTWVAEMFMSGEEAVKRAAEIERLQGKTPETKRRNEIKAGVITASAGVALMIALFMIMEGIILGGRVSDAAAAILSRIWIVGVIPLFVGLALIVNGMFVSKRIDIHNTEKPWQEPEFLPPAETNQLAADIPFSITDETTQHLKTPEKSAPKN
ncbi:MAG TPA: hypothetical protein VGQ55_12950 [Pyrinomonadaceae bacterium]|jgi:hypothetical protein|nr:hypothetical protein [Pyrinomonadaceae bacterium]